MTCLSAALIGAAGALALAQGDAGERLRPRVSDSCAAAAQVSAQNLAAHLADCQSRALALLRLEARRADVVATDDDEAASGAASTQGFMRRSMQGSPPARMTPGERAQALARRCALLGAPCESR